MEVFLEQLQQMSWTEAIAAVLGIVSVLYLQAGRVWGYPLGMLSVGLYVWICYEAKIYAHVGVNAYYFFMSVYGWYHWLRGEKGTPARYGYCKNWEYGTLLLGIPLCFGLLYVVLQATDSNIALWDASTTSIWVAAMWLMARKRIENWLGWMLSDAICVPLYFYKGLTLTSVQMLLFFCLATRGFFNWRRMYRQQLIENNE